MTPEQHAMLSVRDYGGDILDYYPVHYMMDYSKHFLTNGHAMHRAFSHNWWGISVIQNCFDKVLINGVSVRQLLIDHVRQDCGVVPTLQECLDSIIDGSYMQKYNKPNKKDIEWIQQKLKLN